jgi:hypothetical protein
MCWFCSRISSFSAISTKRNECGLPDEPLRLELVDAAMWDDLLAAFGLMLVLEGILPFLSPRALCVRPCSRWRNWRIASCGSPVWSAWRWDCWCCISSAEPIPA